MISHRLERWQGSIHRSCPMSLSISFVCNQNPRAVSRTKALHASITFVSDEFFFIACFTLLLHLLR